MKSPLMALWTSGRRKRSPVLVSWVRSLGASMSGRGEGRVVRCGFWEMPVLMASRDSGGVMTVMSASNQDGGFSTLRLLGSLVTPMR